MSLANFRSSSIWQVLIVLYLFSAMKFGIINLAHLLALVLLIYLFSFEKRQIRGTLLIIIVFTFKLIYDLLVIGVQEVNYPTYLLTLINGLLIYYAFVCKSNKIPKYKHLHLFVKLISLHGCFLCLQFILFNVFSDFSLLNPFGGLSPYGPDPTTSSQVPYNPSLQFIKRPNGLNWEPSVAGLWQLIGLAVAIHLYINKQIGMKHIIGIVCGALATFSLLTWVSLFLVFMLILYNHSGAKIQILLGCVLIYFFILYLGGGINLNFGGRMAEFNTSGSSGYSRIIAPILYINESGIGIFGSEALGYRNYNFFHAFLESNGRGINSGIANSYLELIIYFGLTGIIFLISGFCLLLINLQKNSSNLTYCLLVGVLIFTFGGYLFNTVIIYSISVFILLSRTLKKHLEN